jgi:uncharacterized membrane protein YhiD involved in acid resistance
MQPVIDPLFNALGSTRTLEPLEAFYSLSVAFILGLVLTTVYRWTHQGFSYARSFLHTLVLATITVCIMIMAIGNNMARGLGILGAMAFVRFRTPIRDPRDIIFLFCALAVGIACGAQVFMISILGTLFFCFAALFLAWSPFASRREFEGLLRFMLPAGGRGIERLTEITGQYCSTVEMIAMREAIQGEVLEYSYQVRLLDPSYKVDLVDAVAKIPDISEVSLIMQRTTVEI